MPETLPLRSSSPQQTCRCLSVPLTRLLRVRENAIAARKVIEQEFPDYMRDHLGRGKWNKPAFDAWRNGLPGDRRELFNATWKDVQAERPYAAKMNSRSVYTQMVEENGGWKSEPASSSASATPPANTALPPSSNGSRGGNGSKPPATTPAPAEPEDNFWSSRDSSSQPSYDELRWMNEQDAVNYIPETHREDIPVAEQQFAARSRELQAERRVDFRGAVGNFPMSARQLTDTAEAARAGNVDRWGKCIWRQ